MEIVKAIIPAAGLGTRFLPYTKNIPKEMLPIIADKSSVYPKPALQLIVEEALASSLSQFMIITRSGKQSISDFFDISAQLDPVFSERQRSEHLTSLHRIRKLAQFTYIHQPEPLGLGHALWLARHTIGKEYCAIFLPDDLLISEQPGMAQLMRIARQEKASVIAVQEVPSSELSRYGVVAIKKQVTPNLYQVAHVVEKPESHKAPSNLAVIGRYVLSHKIFTALEELSSYATEELQLTDAITCMLHHNERVFAYKIDAVRYDIGTPLGWLKATIGYALSNPYVATQLQEYCLELGLSLPVAPLFHPVGTRDESILP